MKALHVHQCPLPDYAPHDNFVWTCPTPSCRRKYMAEAHNPGDIIEYFQWRAMGPAETIATEASPLPQCSPNCQDYPLCRCGGHE